MFSLLNQIAGVIAYLMGLSNDYIVNTALCSVNLETYFISNQVMLKNFVVKVDRSHYIIR